MDVLKFNNKEKARLFTFIFHFKSQTVSLFSWKTELMVEWYPVNRNLKSAIV